MMVSVVHYDRGILERADLKIVLFLGVLSLSVISLIYVRGETPDTNRFVSQAHSISSGDGYRTNGYLETFLPPGYPLFIAGLEPIGGLELIRKAQIVLVAAAPLLLFFSLKNKSAKLAIALSIALAIHPLAVRLVGFLLSESLGLFLCALMIFLFSRCFGAQCSNNGNCSDRSLGGLFGYFLLGSVIVALTLTSPGSIVLCGFIGLYAFFHLSIMRLKLSALLSFLLGISAIMVPWQIHCINANGSPCWLIFTQNPIYTSENHYYQWFRTWSQGEIDMPALWGHDSSLGKSDIPKSLLAIDAELTNNDDYASLLKNATNLARQDFIHQIIELPLLRSISYWFYLPRYYYDQMKQMCYLIRLDSMCQPDFTGLESNSLTSRVKSFFIHFIYLLYISYPVMFIGALVLSLRYKCAISFLIFLSVLIFTFIAGYLALGEVRRNVVFLPALLYAVGLALAKRRAHLNRMAVTH